MKIVNWETHGLVCNILLALMILNTHAKCLHYKENIGEDLFVREESEIYKDIGLRMHNPLLNAMAFAFKATKIILYCKLFTSTPRNFCILGNYFISLWWFCIPAGEMKMNRYFFLKYFQVSNFHILMSIYVTCEINRDWNIVLQYESMASQKSRAACTSTERYEKPGSLPCAKN